MPRTFTTGGGSGNTKITVDPTSVSISNGAGGVETTLFTTTVPGGTLSTNNAIRGMIFFSSLGLNSGSNLNIRIKYGGTTMVQMSITGGASVNYGAGELQFWILANMVDNAQKMGGCYRINTNLCETNGDTNILMNKAFSCEGGTAAVNSALDQSLVVTAQYSAGGGSDDLIAEFFILERIT